jgi:hypothetical protein
MQPIPGIDVAGTVIDRSPACAPDRKWPAASAASGLIALQGLRDSEAVDAARQASDARDERAGSSTNGRLASALMVGLASL